MSFIQLFNDSKVWSVFRKYIGPVVVAALAILVVCLNFSMMSGPCAVGDEVFMNTVYKDVDGILQVLYY